MLLRNIFVDYWLLVVNMEIFYFEFCIFIATFD